MDDFEIIDGSRRPNSFRSVIGTDTVIVSHAVDPLAELSYYQYLQGLGQRVVLLASKDNPLVHLMNESHEFGFETYNDPDRHLATKLKQDWHLDPDLDALSRQLRFQILYVEGQEVGAWYQPVNQQWKHFLADRTAVKSFIRLFGTAGTKWLNNQDKSDNLLWTSYSQDAYPRGTFTPDERYETFLKYYNLMPNESLVRMLNA